MYRIELGPDDIGVFRSIEELARAIKTGVITTKARIYHSASDKWLPIEFHPHYRKAREMAAGPVPPAPPTPPPVPAPSPRVDTSSVRVRTPLPAPSAVAGLPLIDVSAPAPPAPVTIWSPAPVRLAPEPATAAVAPHPPVAEAPEPLPPLPMIVAPSPDAERTAPPSESVSLVHSSEPEPDLHYAPEARPRRLEPAVAQLPEPERDAIFLAVEAPALVAEPIEPEPDPVVAEPVLEEPRVAAPSPAFHLPRVDLRLRERRRPILVAAAAVTLAASTHFAMQHGSGLVEGMSVPLPDLRPRAIRAELPTMPDPTNASVLPASIPAKGSPSFGGASAFSTPTPVTENPPPPPRDTAAPVAVPAVAPPPKVVIAAPKITAVPSLEGDLKSAAGLIGRYDAAYASARAELDNGLKTAGFANLFATARLRPDGLRAARASVGTAAAYVQRYRRRETEIEQAYRDSFDLLAGRNKWSDGQRRTWESRKIAKEHPEISKLAGFLLQSLDSLYGLLAAQEGAYRLENGRIVFDDATASRAYAELRPWLDRRAHAWADTGGAEPTTASRILQAMGTLNLPEGEGL